MDSSRRSDEEKELPSVKFSELKAAIHGILADKKANSKNDWVLCRICEQPVSLEQAVFDETGQPVHEDCYVALIQTGDDQTLISFLCQQTAKEPDHKKFTVLVGKLNNVLRRKELRLAKKDKPSQPFGEI